MLSADFNRAFGSLLAAFNRREDLRQKKATLAERAAAAQELHRARMAVYRAMTVTPTR